LRSPGPAKRRLAPASVQVQAPVQMQAALVQAQ
jgi:hypothetical protein